MVKTYVLSEYKTLNKGILLFCATLPQYHKANEEAWAVYYTVIKHSRHLRILDKYRNHSPAARGFYIAIVSLKNVQSQNNRWRRLMSGIKHQNIAFLNQPCVCLVIGHRRRQNVVRTTVTHVAIASLFFCYFFVLSGCSLNKISNWNYIKGVLSVSFSNFTFGFHGFHLKKCK